MSLITKKLEKLQENTKVDITINDATRTRYTGFVTANDFSEALEIQTESGEFIVSYSEVMSVMVFQDNNTTNNAAPITNRVVTAPVSVQAQTPHQTVAKNCSTIINKLSFYTDPISFPKISDNNLKLYFQNTLTVDERKIANNQYQSIVNKLKHNDTTSINISIQKMIDSFESFKTPLSKRVMRFILALQVRGGCKLSIELAERFSVYNYLAVHHYITNDFEKAVAFSCAALLYESDENFKEILYTIIAQAAINNGDTCALSYILSSEPNFVFEKNMQEILETVYAANNTPFSTNINRNSIISKLKDFCKNNSTENHLKALLTQVQTDKTLSNVETENSSKFSSNSTSGNSDTIKQGEMFYLSWSSESGKILSNGEEYKFSYSDIVDIDLLNKIKNIYASDLKRINSVFNVSFTSKIAGKATDIKKLNKPIISGSSPKNSSTSSETTTSVRYESSLKKARNITSKIYNPDRFEESLPWFEMALNEEKDPLIPLSEYINCCAAIAKRKDQEYYLNKAYETYLRYKALADQTIGITNVSILGLLLKMKKNDEALVVCERILADNKITPDNRLTYILQKAKLYQERAAAMEASQNYTEDKIAETYKNAQAGYNDWEQLYNGNQTFRYNTNYNKIYYNTVLLGMAHCFSKIGETEKAKEILKRIKNFDPTNENAIALLNDIDVPQSSDNEPVTQLNDHTGSTDIHTYYTDEVDYDEEDLISDVDVEYKDVSNWSALNLTEKDIVEYAIGLIAQKRMPIAVAYLKAASVLNQKLAPEYKIASYALNNPIENLNYSLDNIVLVFHDIDPICPAFYKYANIASVLRGSFYHSVEKDYFNASAYLDNDIMATMPELLNAFRIIEDFRTATGKGMDIHAEYRYHSEESKQAVLAKLSKNAETLYDCYFGRFFHENVSQKRFKLTKTIVFEKGGFIDQLLKCVIDNNTEQFNKLRDQFTGIFFRSGVVVSTENIDNEKIDAFIDEAWAKAGKDRSIHERRSSTLMGSLRNNLRIPINKIVELVCSWYALNSHENEYGSKSLDLYRSSRDELMDLLVQAKDQINQQKISGDVQIEAGIAVLELTIDEIIDRINGKWSDEKRHYYFSDFLSTDHVLLDEANLPDLTFTFCGLPNFNILARIRAHAETKDADIVSHAVNIYTKDPDNHDFGTAKKIADYLQFNNRESEWSLPENSEAFDEQAKKQTRECYDRFNIDLASARSRGQIKVSDAFLQSIDETAQSLYQFCVDSHNYGFFFRFVALCQNIIHDNALEYGTILTTQLEQLSKDIAIDDETFQKISGYIETQQFTVAEEMMYRVSAGYNNDIINADFHQFATDHLNDFLKEYNSNYDAVAKDTGKSLVKIMSNRSAMKDRRGAEALLNNWPRGATCTADQIETLLRLLGWSDIKVDKSHIVPNLKLSNFHAKPNFRIFSQREYAHPIAAFGTQATNEGFYVVCQFGTTDSTRLIDLCKRLDSVAGNKILLIDFALSMAERRKLARIMKQVSLFNTYLFIDRISLLYLANHYIGGIGDANNRALFAISMPFTYYQPYSIGSTTVTPPELFSGRKDELLSVESPTGANLIYGGRQLGKTAILQKAVNETHDPENGRYALAIDIKEKNCKEAALKISRHLNIEGILSEDQITDDWEQFAHYIHKNIISKSISFILLMLDEADCFIEDCRNFEFAPVVALKDIQQSTNGRFKFVLAGLHNIVKFKREVALGNNSVIAHLSSINVKPFDFETAKILLREPLGYLGFEFDGDETAFMQICSATNYYPGLLQYFCNKLIESLKVNYGGYSESNSPGYKITTRQISQVLADKEFMAAIKEKFEITLRLGDGNYYYILALLLALLYEEKENSEGYNIDEILDMANNVGISLLDVLSKEHISALLDELCDLNILRMVGSGYAFRTRSFRDLLGSKEDLENQLLNLIDG